VPPKAKNYAEKAIELGLTSPESAASAQQIVGRYNLGVNKLEDAVQNFSMGIEAAKKANDPNLTISPLYHRSLAYRRQEQYESAYQDLQQAMTLARSTNLKDAITFLEKELKAVSQHAGRPLDQINLPPG
jgi:tetratricopeptide (TPR) repeat protein